MYVRQSVHEQSNTTMSAQKDVLHAYNFVYDTRENVQGYFNTLKFKFFETGKSSLIYVYILIPVLCTYICMCTFVFKSSNGKASYFWRHA